VFNTDDFFKVLEYLKNGEEDPTIPPEIRQLAQNAKLKTKQFFKYVIDQIAFNSDDYNRLRTLIIDWYSSQKTLQDLSKNTSDAFSLPGTLLNISCRSFGFPYADGIGSRVDKALFLYSLTELYKIKGSPKSIKSALEFFGVYDTQIFEWWIKKDLVTDKLYFESSYVDLGGVDPESLQNQKIPYDHFTTDPHWWYNEEQIKILDNTLPIRLPSITPYFNIQASASLDKLTELYSVISRRISDQYTTYINDNILDQNIFVDIYAQNLSLLELVLSISYTFNTWTNRTYGSDSTSYIHYVGDEEDYDVIIDEYNNITQRPTTKDELEARKQEFNSKFTKQQSANFLSSDVDTANILSTINPDLKAWIDNKFITPDIIESILSQFLRELDIYIRMEFGTQALSFSQIMLGNDVDDILDVINFFKPKRARLLAFNLVYAVDDPLFNSILLGDTLHNRIRQWDEEQYNYYDHLNNTKITQWNYEAFFHSSSGTGHNSCGFDVGNYFDNYPSCINIHDDLFTIIRHFNKDVLLTYDKFQIPYINLSFNEYGRSPIFDRCGIFDTRMQVWDCEKTSLTQTFHDRAYMCRHLPFDLGDHFDTCGRIANPYDRNKTFDSGYIFDVDGYPLPRRYDSNTRFDEKTGLFIPWWVEGPDPEYVCTCDKLNLSLRKKYNDNVNITEQINYSPILSFNDKLEQSLTTFDMDDHFDSPSVYFKDGLIQSTNIFLGDSLSDTLNRMFNFSFINQHSVDIEDNLQHVKVNDNFNDSVPLLDSIQIVVNAVPPP